MTALSSRLDPPPSLVPTLQTFNDGIQRQHDLISELLKLSGTSPIRVHTKSGLQVNLQFQLQQIGNKWHEVCQRSRVVPYGFGAYGNFVEQHLPKLVELEPTSMEDMLDMCRVIATVYHTQASGFYEEMQSAISEIKFIIASLEQSVETLQPNLITLESISQGELVGVSDGILSIILADIVEDAFDASSILLACDDATLARLMKDNASLKAPFQYIHEAIRAIGLSRTIDEIKKTVAISSSIAKWLQSQLPMYEGTSALTFNTADAWQGVHDGLKGLNQQAQNVNRVLSAGEGNKPLSSWQEVHRLTASKVQTGQSTAALSDGQSDDSGALQAFFAAPLVSGRVLQPKDLSQLIQEYANASQTLYNALQNDIAGESAQIETLIKDSTLPTSSIAGQALKQFASRQPEIPSLPIEQTAWESFCNARMPQLKDGSKKVQEAYDAIYNLQSKSSDLSTHIKSRITELSLTLERIRQSTREKRDERARQQQLLAQIPLAWAIKRLIDQLSGEIDRLEEEDRQTDRYIQSLMETRGITNSVGERVVGLTNLTTGMSRFWLDLQVVMNTANVVWPILHKLQKLPQEEIDLYKKTWDAVRVAVQEW
ncbi:hypothetical protein LTR84_008820 [Exophiala bonariae]|uniref:Uncharacterized protein n=1 Tax=Exophiala bonariae TaxID=1690606 RepID=A0AAV9MWG8_9EURO|nr:hypothetical protein LTR84_008820 [Exophiala bonariae]